MKKILLIVIVLIAGCSKEPINVRILEQIDNVMYTKDTNKLYSGAVFSLYKDGQKKWEGNLEGGKQIGKWTKYYESGNKKIEENYQDGKIQGKYTEYYENGQMKYIREYATEKEYNNDEGLLISYWAKTGEQLVTNGNGGISWFDEYDNLVKEEFYIEGKKDGKWFENDSEYKEDSIVNLKNGKKHGESTTSYNRRLRSVENYKDGKEHGKWVTYHSDGDISIKYWENGNKDG